MNVGWRRMILGAMAALIVCLLSVVSVRSQAGPAEPPMAEAVFKNIQVLKGIPVDEFMETMGMFAAAADLPVWCKYVGTQFSPIPPIFATFSPIP